MYLFNDKVAFTIKELRELSNLPATKLHIHMDSDWNSLYQSLGVSDACLAEDLLKSMKLFMITDYSNYFNRTSSIICNC